MKFKNILFLILLLVAIGLAVYYNLPKESITITELKPTYLPPKIIP